LAIVYFQHYFNYRSSPTFWASFPHCKSYVIILANKMGWAIFWAIFSQPHPVTLAASMAGGAEIFPSRHRLQFWQTSCLPI
jgi:hypothetical protein